jgi:hypothetical protein
MDIFRLSGIIIEASALAGACAIMGVVYILILSREPILNWWFRFGARFEGRFFWKPIWGCELCFSGQAALWMYIILTGACPCLPKHMDAAGVAAWIAAGAVWLFWLIYTICTAVFMAYILASLYFTVRKHNQKIK